jgi:F0F1-type ATP synthase membrane subunit b/b'
MTMPLAVGAALLASADGYTPRANASLDKAREELGSIGEIANALADNLPAPKLTARKSRRRRRKRKGQAQAPAQLDDAKQAPSATAESDGATSLG